jgi:hypothetical protein
VDLNHRPLPYQVGTLRATFAITAVGVSSSVHHYPKAARRKVMNG